MVKHFATANSYVYGTLHRCYKNGSTNYKAMSAMLINWLIKWDYLVATANSYV